MTIIGLILFIIIVGLIMWLINKLPMPGAIKGLLNLIVFVLLVIYVLQFFGVINPIIPLPFKIAI